MHHANLFIGRVEWARAQIPESDRTESVDVSICVYERMSIADVRTLIHDANLMPVEAPMRTFILIVNSILPEAQNALLKLFEEPPLTTRFYIITENEGMLLPTLRSRLNVLGKEEYSTETSAFKKFYDAGYAERLSLIAEKLKAEDTKWIAELVHGLELHAHTTHNVDLLKDTLILLSYIRSAGSSKKMLLEHIALTL